MQAASSPRRNKTLQAGAAPARTGPQSESVSLTMAELDAARQEYIDALPIAAAVLIVGTTGSVRIEIANDHFRDAARWDDRLNGAAVDDADLIAGVGIGDALRQFIDSGEPACQFESHDGHAVGGRHLTVRLVRLRPLADASWRCLVALIDKTAQIETEKSLRAEMLRDSLTGLPNRLAFNERIEAILSSPDFEEGSYAVLVVDMRRFSRVNESMGAIAGDELLITFARRLCSALRGGDILARTGGDEFGILMRLNRGLDDALQLGERIERVLATPFRLSEMEIRVECSVGCALLSGRVELAEEVLRNAQFALKRSKQSGQIQIYEPNQARAARAWLGS